MLSEKPHRKKIQTPALHPLRLSGGFFHSLSDLTWELMPEGRGTRVKLTHEGLENFADAGPEFAPENYAKGWDAIVRSNLKNYLYGVRKKTYRITINSYRRV